MARAETLRDALKNQDKMSAGKPEAGCKTPEPYPEQTLPDPLPSIDADAAIENIVGQEEIKRSLKDFKHQITMDARRLELGFELETMRPPHMMFLGNPGTGKTTIAKIVASVLKERGLLSHGQFVEVQRSDLVGAHVGATALKTRAVINSAKGGVLFVDEAYTLAKKGGESSNDFGSEAINELMSAMNDGDPVMIFAGYEKEMSDFVASNAGLFRRIERQFHFADYTPDQLGQMLLYKIAKQRFHLALELNTAQALGAIIKESTSPEQRTLMNGGITQLILNNAKRILDARMTAKSTLEELCTYNKSDISAAAALIAKPLEGKADAKLKGCNEQSPTFHTPPAPPSHVPIRMVHDQAGLVHCS